jgi:hypothetical protein
MGDKKQYYGLDDIGFIGSQDRTPAQVKRDMRKMAEYIRSEKAGRIIARSGKPTRRLSKAK